MSRAFVTIVMMAAVAVMGSKLYVQNVDREVVASIDIRQFIVLRNEKDSAALQQRRQECGNLQAQVAELNSRIGDQSSQEEGDLEYDEVVGDVVEHLTFSGTIPSECIMPAYNSKTLDLFEGVAMVMLSTNGDVAIGYAGKATTSWSEVIRLDSWRPDVLMTEDGSKLAIKLG